MGTVQIGLGQTNSVTTIFALIIIRIECGRNKLNIKKTKKININSQCYINEFVRSKIKSLNVVRSL